ncbi:MAG: integrase [Candidatus Bathyarchaeia archaeon]
MRGDFQVYLGRYNSKTASCILSYLDRFVGDRPIRGPEDIMMVFNGLSGGQIHQLDRALRAFLNFCLLKGYPEDWIRLLKKAFPKEPPLIDLKVPEESEVLEGLGRTRFIPLKYKTLWVLCLESGLRVVEAASLINNFSPERIVELNGFYRYQIGAFRGSKQAYFAYFADESLDLIKANKERIIEANASHYYAKYDILAPKYLRKFAFDRLVSLGVPESIADFIEGRAPRRIGARHYMSLVKQADSYYGRYAEYLRALREKCGDLRIS